MTTNQDNTAPQTRVVDSLAQDARVVEARMLPAEGPITQEQHDALRVEFKKYCELKGLAYSDVGKQIGRSGATISQYLSDTYAGNNDATARLLAIFIDQHKRGEKPGMPRGYITTTVVERMLGLLRKVQAHQLMGVIFGPAGLSKSLVCRAAESGLIVGSTHFECVKGHKSAAKFAQHWADRIGISLKKGRRSLADAELAIINALRNTRRLQMIDEAQYLSNDALNVVRDVHKQAGVGVVLIGTVDVNNRVNDALAHYGQISSLIAYRYDIVEEQSITGRPILTVQNIVDLATSMQLRLTGEGAELLTEMACVPGWGGLRAAATLLLRAKALAKGNAIDARNLIDAESQSQGTAWAKYTESRREVNRRSVKVA